MRDPTNVNTRGSDRIFYLSSAVCVVYIIMRVLLADTMFFSPQTVFLNGVALVALVTALISRLLSNGLILPQKKLLVVLGIFILCLSIAVLHAQAVGYYNSASSVLENIISDIFVFFAVMITARERNVFRVYVSSLGAMICVVGVYALYQKIYALDYLHDIALNSTSFRDSLKSKGEVLVQAFIQRIEDGWIGGGFGDAAALCAFSILVIIILSGVRSKEQHRFKFDVVLFLGIVGVVFSESLYGIVLCKLFELILLYKFVKVKSRFYRDFLLVFGGVGVTTIFSLILSLALWLAVGSVIGLITLSLLWYFEFEYLRIRYSTGINKSSEYLVGLGALVLILLLLAVIIISPAESELGYFRDFSIFKVSKAFISASAALKAFLAAPVFGWGLDNFSDVHSLYKSPVSTGLGRASNIYLQLLADGGIVLFGGFILVTGVMLFSGSVERRGHKEVEFKGSEFKKMGPSLIIASFVISYVFVALGIFDHMGVRYFFNELLARPESSIVRNVSITPLVVHFLVNFFLLPFIGVYGFKKIWVLSRDIDLSFVEGTLKLSLIAFLFYGICMDFLYLPTLGGIFWVVGGLLISRKRSWGMLNFGHRFRAVLIYCVLLLGLGWGVWGTWESFVSSITERVAFSNIGVSGDTVKVRAGVKAFDNALVYSPKNADLYVERANLIITLYGLQPEKVSSTELEKAMSDVNTAIKLRPYESSYLIVLARMLEVFDYNENKEKIATLYRTAHAIYPNNARYIYLYAKYLMKCGDTQNAKLEAAKAIKLNTDFDYDPTTRLKKFQIYKARGIVNGITER